MNELIFVVEEAPEEGLLHAHSANQFLPKPTPWPNYLRRLKMQFAVILRRERVQKLSVFTMPAKKSSRFEPSP